MLELVLGGARSGKSHYAQSRAEKSGLDVTFIATATAGDQEMRQRIENHRKQRPNDWQTIEEPIRLAAALDSIQAKGRFVIVDCLTLWLSNLLSDTQHLDSEMAALFEVLPLIDNDVVFVSNEVGMGIVPMGELNRRFVDETGRLHQRFAQQCQRVTQLIAGIPNVIKQ